MNDARIAEIEARLAALPLAGHFVVMQAVPEWLMQAATMNQIRALVQEDVPYLLDELRRMPGGAVTTFDELHSALVAIAGKPADQRAWLSERGMTVPADRFLMQKVALVALGLAGEGWGDSRTGRFCNRPGPPGIY